MKSKWLTTISVTALAFGASAGTTLAAGMDDLIAAAKKEGMLTTIALPHDWCGYGDVIAGFKAKYGLTVNELNPDAGSGDEIEAIKANKGNTGPQAPDVIDVGLSFGPSAKADGLIQPYKVATWDTIPDSAKDADGAWYGDYYGVLVVRGEHRHRQEVAGRLGRPAGPTTERRWRSPAIRAPPTRPSRASMLPASPTGRRRREGGRCGPEVVRRTQQGRELRAGDRQGGLAGTRLDPGRHRLGLQRALGARHPEGQPADDVIVPRPASSPASTSRRSAPSRRIRTPPSCGWSTSIRTRASSAG